MKLSDNRYEVRVTNYEVKNPRAARPAAPDDKRAPESNLRGLFMPLAQLGIQQN